MGRAPRPRRRLRRTVLAGALGAGAALAVLVAGATPVPVAGAASGSSGLVSENLSFTTEDGTVLQAAVAGYGSLAPRPVIVEDSPYAPAVSTLSWVGPQFTFVELQWRGTGASGGSLDTTGRQDQSDLAQFLGWACTQPWSDGRIGLYGFSASAIVVYNAMHLQLPCVQAAALMAGTTDLYRDLFYIGGIFNWAAGAFVGEQIGQDTLEAGGTRLQDDPSSGPAAALGFVASALEVQRNTTEDSYWEQRTFQGDADHIPVLADTSFYDVEEDGPFAAFDATEAYGSHLIVEGAHDGFPAGTPGPFPQFRNWFQHYLLGEPLSAANQPTVSLMVGNGNRQQFLDGNITTLTGTAWPLPGTSWTSLYLSPAPSSSPAGSLDNGSLATSPPAGSSRQSYPFVPSEPSETDLHNTSVVDGELDEIDSVLPETNDMALSGGAALTYTSPPLASPLVAVGPGAIDLWASSLEPYTDLYAVLADVWPDGTAYPVATGALRTLYPDIDTSRSLVDPQGDVVDPYNLYDRADPAAPGQTREYQVELLPMGNVFAAGSRLRLYILGTPADQLGAPPGLDTISLGGATPSRLLLPSIDGAPAFGG
jgi:putative CocE/NonD family hydrolase